MRSREYYSQIETIVKECPFVIHFSIEFDEIDLTNGYLKGKLELIDGSSLHFIELFEIQKNIPNLIKYKYQWQFENGDLIMRWDNVSHHPEINTFPHHMHDKKGVHSSSDINLRKVIEIIIDKII